MEFLSIGWKWSQIKSIFVRESWDVIVNPNLNPLHISPMHVYFAIRHSKDYFSLLIPSNYTFIFIQSSPFDAF